MAINTECKNCSLNPLCLPIALEGNDIDKLDAIIKRGRPIKKGELLFQQGQPFTSVYAVRAGTLKSYTVTNSGEEQITGFQLASELVGLESFDSETYPSSAKALETTSVCEIPFDSLDQLSGELPELRRQLLRTMGQEIRDEQQMMLLLSKKTAEEKLATFILNMAARFKRRGFSETTFRLAMSRADMANYLGLAVETVSRVFTRFQSNDVISFGSNAKDITISNRDELLKIADITSCEPECV